MQLQANETVELVDAAGRDIAQITVERTDEDLVLGRWTPGPAFADVQPLFRQFEDAVNLQALHRVDEFDAVIRALGLHIRRADESRSLAIHDVQIWSDGNVSCRLGEPAQSSIDRHVLTPEPVPAGSVSPGSG